MNRYRNYVLPVASVSLGLLLAVPARGAALTEVPRATWAGSVTLPSYVKMYVYVPDDKASKPPIMVSSHSCGSTASGQMGNIPKIKAAADKYGFILILPDNPNQNCWDVGSDQSLKHDGGGDTQAVAQMVKYALSTYSGDASRVYAMGGSSGGMMTQALMAVYPDVFMAGSARAGVPAGCWREGYASSNQWSGSCAGGNVHKTGQQWGDLVRAMFPNYTGHRPRIQLIQGGSDTTISSKNMDESIAEWTNVLGLSTNATSKDSITTSVATYDRQFWQNACGYVVLESWVAPGKDHSMAYEEDAILKFFGLDTASTSDPEPPCSGGGGSGAGGASGASGAGGVSAPSGGTAGNAGRVGNGGGSTKGGAGGSANGGGSAKAGAVGIGGADGNGGSSSSVGTATGGAATTGGRTGSGGASPRPTGGAVGNGGSPVSGGTSAMGGTSSTGGAVGTGGTVAIGASSATGGSGNSGLGGIQGSGGATAPSGASDAAGAASTSESSTASGCSCVVGRNTGHSIPKLAALLLAALGLTRRRRKPGFVTRRQLEATGHFTAGEVRR